MKIDLKVLSNNETQATTDGVKKMRMSDDAQSMVFQLFTKNVYSNPIGTVVREITSNCFDSHEEAGVKTPVVIKRSYDETSDTHYISFIDYGVGMSPDRVENIYGVYFESTKRQTDDQIGGFGIGGKTPLAYKRSTGQGEGEYDNSFFVITNYEGKQYYYTVFEGAETPEFVLLDTQDTDERNGTEIRIPVLERDWDKFESEIKRQLHYFENIIFEGFGDDITNDYKIIRGKNFLYREHSVYSQIHVCLGKVAYPLDFDLLGLDAYQYNIPVAINVPIGKIGVTVSRESLNYSEQTLKYLKQRIQDVIDELKEMLSIKYENVHTLKDYFNAKQNFGKLELVQGEFLDLRSLIKPSEIDYTNYKYNTINTPSSDRLFTFFFNVNIYGKKELKGWRRRSTDFEYIQRDYDKLSNTSNVLYHEDAEFTRKRNVQAYLKETYGRFYVITKTDVSELTETAISDVFNVDLTELIMSRDEFMSIVAEMQEEYFEIVRNSARAGNYEDVEVPKEFLENRKKKRVTEEMKKFSIPLKFANGWSRQRVKLAHLFSLKEKIFYGTTNDEHKLNVAHSIFKELFPDVGTINGWNEWDNKWSTGYYSRNSKKKIMFVRVAKNNVQYMEYCKNAYHIDHFYTKMLYRKADLVMEYFKYKDHINSIERIGDFYQSDLIKEINPRWGKMIDDIADFYSSISHLKKYSSLEYRTNLFKKYFNIDNNKPSKKGLKIEQMVEKVLRLQNKNAEILNYINLPYDINAISDEKRKIIIDILTKVMDFR